MIRYLTSLQLEVLRAIASKRTRGATAPYVNRWLRNRPKSLQAFTLIRRLEDKGCIRRTKDTSHPYVYKLTNLGQQALIQECGYKPSDFDYEEAIAS